MTQAKNGKKKRSPLPVLIAIVLAIVVGSLTGRDFSLLGVSTFALFDFFGQIFINALMLVVVPLVSSSIITGIARIGGEGSLGRLGVKTFLFYLGTSFLAIIIGVIMVNITQPGKYISSQVEQANQEVVAKLNQSVEEGEGKRVLEIFRQIIPSNVIDAFEHGNMLGLIFFSLLFGYAVSKVHDESGSTLLHFWQGIFKTMIHFTHIIMKFLPFGVFCLVAKVFAETGIGSLGSVALFFLTVLLGLSIFVFIALPLLLKFVGRVNPLRHFRAMAPALITAFSTSSSSASLPVTLDCVEKRVGVSNRICSLVIPLGTSINLSGSALYEAVAALFVAQAYGVALPFFKQLLFAFITLLTSIGVAGVPSGSLVAIIVILKAMGLPIEGISLFIAVDRILDMCRTTANVFSDSCCAVLVARSEGEQDVLTRSKFSEEG